MAALSDLPDLPDLVAQMAFDPHVGILALDDHIGALKADADARGYRFDRHDVRNELQAATFRLREPRAIRLLVSPTGAIAIEVMPA